MPFRAFLTQQSLLDNLLLYRDRQFNRIQEGTAQRASVAFVFFSKNIFSGIWNIYTEIWRKGLNIVNAA